MRWLCLLLISAALAQEPPRLATVPGDRVRVSSPYWTLEFDLRSGGELASIVFPHGSGRNVLAEPFRTAVDQWTDAFAPVTEFHSSTAGGAVLLEFSGTLASAGRAPGPVAFRTAWSISDFTVRADHTLRFPAELAASTVAIGSTAMRADLDEFGLRTGPADDTDRRKQAPALFAKSGAPGQVLVDEHHAPLYLLFFHRGEEGFDITTGSDLYAWESRLTSRGGTGRFQASVAANGASIRLLREPLHVPQPQRIRKGDYTFRYYLGLPRIVGKSPRKWRHLSFGNHPWPSDAEIARWAEAGVNIVRLHNDYVADENFWHDGAWPPYDAQGMAELRRVIAACHRRGIQVVPYFSLHEFHPKAESYEQNEADWCSACSHGRAGRTRSTRRPCACSAPSAPTSSRTTGSATPTPARSTPPGRMFTARFMDRAAERW